MTAFLLGLLAAFLYSLSQVCTRRAVEDNEPEAVVLGTLTITFLALSTLMLARNGQIVWPASGALGVLIAAGVIAPGLARVLGAHGLRDFGPLVAVPFQFGTRPVVALVAGVVVFDEAVPAVRILALGTIGLGLAWLTTGSTSERGATSVDSRRLWIPAAAGLAYAISEVLRKLGVASSDALPAAWIAGAAAFTVALTIAAVVPGLRVGLGRLSKRGWIVLSGGAAALAQVVMFTALERGDITIVSPVMAMQPMIVMVIAPRLTATGSITVGSVWKGGLLMTTGAVLMAISTGGTR